MSQKNQKKIRLDQALVEQGLVSTKTRAQALILAGEVLVDEQKITKTGTKIKTDSVIRLLSEESHYVSRGALKLLEAIDQFEFTPENQRVLDVGASTGGFTQVLLEKNASKVYAVDVGYGQLAWRLRQDQRVCVYERMHIYDLTLNHLDHEPIDGVVMDVSFISVLKILPHLEKLIKPGTWMVILIKPQFEAESPNLLGKNGVIRDLSVAEKIATDVVDAIRVLGWTLVQDVIPSPILGRQGNREFLSYWRWKEKE